MEDVLDRVLKEAQQKVIRQTKGLEDNWHCQVVKKLEIEYDKRLTSLGKIFGEGILTVGKYPHRLEKEIKSLKKQIAALEKDLAEQCRQTKEFGDELLWFQKKKANVRFEIKLKKYREEIYRLKRENNELRTKKDAQA